MNDNIDHTLSIVTPEQVQLEFTMAGLGSRAAAHLIDGMILAGVNVLLVVAWSLVSHLMDGLLWSFDYAFAILIAAAVLLNVGYLIGTEALMGGQTPGKRVLGLRVLQNNGQSATVLSIIIRNLFRLIDLLPYGYFIGSIAMLASSRDKRLGDMVAGTIVVLERQDERRKRQRLIGKELALWATRLPELGDSAPFGESISPEDWRLLQAWAERVPVMHKPSLARWSQPIAAHFAAKLGHDHHPQLLDDPIAYLLALYKSLREDWEV
ncbi:RDD family protein [Paenibacillus athensensis]|uniref:RDD domain-containing protein n=1 Tax=Paenibacillus athensensis TaxID=1967502 RepID=A0A4Y8Q1F1_9BACL|nr:RDD family protein [Paenibacillus athensensis]MCD1261106.1 RDD family protein [Paenibacillus athensensis]